MINEEQFDDNDNDDAEGDDADDSCPMVVRGRLKLAQPPTTSLPFLSLPRLSQYFLVGFCVFPMLTFKYFRRSRFVYLSI